MCAANADSRPSARRPLGLATDERPPIDGIAGSAARLALRVQPWRVVDAYLSSEIRGSGVQAWIWRHDLQTVAPGAPAEGYEQWLVPLLFDALTDR
jgi:hypothetical protein